MGASRPGWVGVWPIAFSGDGSTVAFRFRATPEEKTFVVVNDREDVTYEHVANPSLSRDGKVVAYRAGNEDSYFIRIGDRVGPTLESVTDPAVSADGSTVAFAYEGKDHWVLVAGDRETPLEDKPFQVFISDDGRRVGWVVFDHLDGGGSKMRVVAGSDKGEPFGIVGRPVFSPDGATVAYGAEEGDRKFVVIGSRKVDSPDRISDPSFSPDGRSVGYGAQSGRELRWRVLDVR